MISLSSGDPKFDGDHFQKWHLVVTYDLLEISKIACKGTWSPIVWVPDYRSEEYFRCASFAVLDFDEGPTKLDIVKRLEGYQYFIGPSKSDGIFKGEKPPCDRFRLCVPFTETIWDLDVFKFNMARLARELGADTQPVHGAVPWRPCKSIQFISLSGRGFDVCKDVPVDQTVEAKKAASKTSIERHKSNKTLPQYVFALLDGKQKKQGNRNKEIFRVACFFFKSGKSFSEVETMMKKLPFYYDKEVGGPAAVESAARQNNVF